MGSTKVNLPPAPTAPAPVNPGESITSYLNSVSDPALQQRLLDVEGLYRPQYTALELQDINTMLLGGSGQRGLLDLNDEAVRRAQALQTETASSQRAADISDVERLGSRASAAFMSANPGLAAAMDRAGRLSSSSLPSGGDAFAAYRAAIKSPTDQSIGRGALGESLYNQALNAGQEDQLTQLLRGQGERLAASTGALTPLEQRAIEQQTRAASVASGRYGDLSSVSSEVGNRIAANRSRQQEDLSAALGINTQLLGARASQQQFAQGVQSQDLSRQEANRGFGFTQQQAYLQGLGLLGQADQQTQQFGQQMAAQQLAQDRSYALALAQQQAALASDPFQAILGRPVTAIGAGGQQQGFAAQLAGQPVGPQLFDPNAGINLALQNNANLANYNANIYGSQAAAAGAAAQGNGSLLGGLFGGLGSVLGGPIGGAVGGGLGKLFK